jgi:hypothetical protein
VLDFRSQGSRPRNYLARSEQTRVLGLVLGVGIVVFALTEAAKPSTWEWMWRAGRTAVPPALDTRLPPSGHLALAAGQTVNKKPEHDTNAVLPGIDKEALAKVKDDAKVFTGERPIEYDILRVLGEMPQSEIARASIGNVSFVEILEQPQAYRGQVVSFDGHVVRCVKVPAGVNDEGIDSYYELVITPDDRPREVLFVHCDELPKGLVEAQKLDEPVHVDALMFKRWAYQASDAQWHSTPLLLTRTVQLKPKPPAAPEKAQANEIDTIVTLAVVSLVVAVALGVMAWMMTRRGVKTNPYARAATKDDPLDYAKLRDLEVSPDAQEALRRITEQSHDRSEARE